MSLDKLKQDYKFLIFRSSQIFGGAKKIAKKGSIFFPIWTKNNFELGKKKIFGGADSQINT
jgi:hypothetical protein